MRHFVTNIRVHESGPTLKVLSNLLIYRTRQDQTRRSCSPASGMTCSAATTRPAAARRADDLPRPDRDRHAQPRPLLLTHAEADHEHRFPRRTTAARSADDLIAELREGLPGGEIPVGLFGNEDIYRRELRSLFGRCWVFLGARVGDRRQRRLRPPQDRRGQLRRRPRRGRRHSRAVRCLPAPRRSGLPRRLGQHLALPLPVPRLDLQHPGRADRRAALAKRLRRDEQGRQRPREGRAGRLVPRLDLRHARPKRTRPSRSIWAACPGISTSSSA